MYIYSKFKSHLRGCEWGIIYICKMIHRIFLPNIMATEIFSFKLLLTVAWKSWFNESLQTFQFHMTLTVNTVYCVFQVNVNGSLEKRLDTSLQKCQVHMTLVLVDKGHLTLDDEGHSHPPFR